MPPRFAYWTIVLDDGPTAFRAATRAELAPTLAQLCAHSREARLMWFARGRYWTSPEEAQRALQREARRPLSERSTRHAGARGRRKRPA